MDLDLDLDLNLFRLGLDSDSNLFGLGLDSDSNLFGLGLVLDSTKVDLTTALLISLPESDMMDTVHLTVGPLTREAAKATVTQHLSLLKLISALHEMFKFGLRFQMWEG